MALIKFDDLKGVTFDDRYCVKTQEEIDAIIQRCIDIFIYYKTQELEEKYAEENGG